MVLNCKHVWEHISEYLDDSLEEALREEVQRHLDHCEVCSAVLDSTRNILVLTGDDRTFSLPLGFSERLHRRLDDEMQRSLHG
ncbi:MAG: zf-HC2 domain-containing protein [Acidobacteriota bacterium]|nr:zf-HC2 domain-containing protein [Acidobacteriota bacterium]